MIHNKNFPDILQQNTMLTVCSSTLNFELKFTLDTQKVIIVALDLMN